MKKVNTLVAAIFTAILVLTGCSNYDAAEHQEYLDDIRATQTPTPSPTQAPTPEPEVEETATTEEETSSTPRINIDTDKAKDKLSEIGQSIEENIDFDRIAPNPTSTDYVAYDRSAFPHWEDMNGNGCDARQETLARDMDNVVLASNGCTVQSGDFYDPASGKHINFTNDGNGGGVDIDHTVPLSYAVQHGNAMNWTTEQRKQFANDPINLEAMDAGTNRSKGDDGTSAWMPADTEYHCEYAQKFETVANKYNIDMPAADKQVIANAC